MNKAVLNSCSLAFFIICIIVAVWGFINPKSKKNTSKDIEGNNLLNSYLEVCKKGNIPFLYSLYTVLNKPTHWICVLSSVINVIIIRGLLIHFGIDVDVYFMVILGLVSFILYGKIIDYYRWHILACGGKVTENGKLTGSITLIEEVDDALIKYIQEKNANS